MSPPLLSARRFIYAVSESIMPKDREVAMFSVTRRVRPSGRLWNPAADVYSTGDGWIVKLDLAGVRAGDVEIQAYESSLRIRGCRRDTFVRDGISYQQMEIMYSQFEKTVQFPCSIEEATLEQDYRDGFLIIHVRCG